MGNRLRHSEGGPYDSAPGIDRSDGRRLRLSGLHCQKSVGDDRDYASNQPIYAQGDPADSLYYLVSGTVKVSVVSEQGKEGVVALLGAASFFGEGCLDGPPLRTSTVTAANTCRVVSIGKDVVQRALAADPAFASVFVRFLLGRTAKLKADLVDQLFNSSEKRLARILLTLAKAGLGSEISVIVPPVTQELLANMVGTTRPRINQFMNKFRELGHIDYDGSRIKVRNTLLDVILKD